MGHWLQRWGRQLRHRFLERDASYALPDDARQRLAHAIAASEAKHSGQIRVYVESALPWSYIRRDAPARERAVMQFGKQRVWDTEHNNGVLIYLLLTDHAIEIVADRGVSRCISGPEWQAMVNSLATDLRSGQYEKALLAAIGQVSRHLELQFPRNAQSAPSTNELDDGLLLG
ncbi:TPM domain-containing protein [Comamonas piscis]|uniref:TPM domain-containing protein n=1 Tax=Comamonas piscis TaxID=1562974 RepID=A0A7G5EBR1_9BURK|nr:TPM domain-containing protein [Comamonas piscis]QMV71436.1 TPM domain-containing protein [Comamonas piscis]WSO34144.1 TPM domain-containing protein [Comamonas piscis]